MGKVTSILIVHDSIEDQSRLRDVIERAAPGVAVIACTGAEAMSVLERQRPDMVLSALRFADATCLPLLQARPVETRRAPFFVLTSGDDDEIALEALRSGADGYIPCTRLAPDLSATLGLLRSQCEKELAARRLSLFWDRTELFFRLENDPALVPALVEQVVSLINQTGFCDEKETTRLGIALHEALLNALYHGNLEVSSQLRQDASDAYWALAEERRHQPPYRDRRIHVRVSLSRHEVVFVIRDEGPGFDLARLPDPTAPENLDKSSGRGVLLIRTFMDEVVFSLGGSQITMIKKRTPAPANAI